MWDVKISYNLQLPNKIKYDFNMVKDTLELATKGTKNVNI